MIGVEAGGISVQITLITVAGAVLVAFIAAVPAYAAARRGKQAQETLGVVNGHGTVAEMGAKALEALDHLGRMLGLVDERVMRLEERHEHRLDRLEERIDSHLVTHAEHHAG